MNDATMNITLTENAVKFFKEALENKPGMQAIRLGIKSSGCAKWSYAIDFTKEIHAEDNIFETNGVKVVVDPKSLPFLAGTEIDYLQDGLNTQIKFNNPNVKSECGCGESFSTEK